MLVASEVKGELARIHPARACCRRAELAGLLYRDGGGFAGAIRTLDHSTARVAMRLAAEVGIAASSSSPTRTPLPRPYGRHHLRVALGSTPTESWSWADAAPCDRRAFLRGVLLASGSISFTAHGAHVEFVFARRPAATTLVRRLADCEVQARLHQRRGRHVVYLKGQDEVAGLLRLTGANRGLLDFESGRVGRDVQNRLNRLINAEEANLARTVRAADRQAQAIALLEARGELARLGAGLRAAAAMRRLQPEADLETLAASLGISRSATNHRLRRLVALASESDAGAMAE